MFRVQPAQNKFCSALITWKVNHVPNCQAVYENGVLRLLSPLNLRERQTVRIQILPEEPADEAEQVIQTLVAAGLVTPPPGRSDVEPVSEEERRELAEILGKAPGKPLSEIIIEETER